MAITQKKDAQKNENIVIKRFLSMYSLLCVVQ